MPHASEHCGSLQLAHEVTFVATQAAATASVLFNAAMQSAEVVFATREACRVNGTRTWCAGCEGTPPDELEVPLCLPWPPPCPRCADADEARSNKANAERPYDARIFGMWFVGRRKLKAMVYKTAARGRATQTQPRLSTGFGKNPSEETQRHKRKPRCKHPLSSLTRDTKSPSVQGR